MILIKNISSADTIADSAHGVRALPGTIVLNAFAHDAVGATNGATNKAIHSSVVERLGALPEYRRRPPDRNYAAATATPLDGVERPLLRTQTAASAAAPMPKVFDLALRH